MDYKADYRAIVRVVHAEQIETVRKTLADVTPRDLPPVIMTYQTKGNSADPVPGSTPIKHLSSHNKHRVHAVMIKASRKDLAVFISEAWAIALPQGR